MFIIFVVVKYEEQNQKYKIVFVPEQIQSETKIVKFVIFAFAKRFPNTWHTIISKQLKNIYHKNNKLIVFQQA